jgi:hypothetical protein
LKLPPAVGKGITKSSLPFIQKTGVIVIAALAIAGNVNY